MYRLNGQITYLVPFNEDHMNDPRYFQWLTDYEVIKTINRPEYLTPVRFEQVKAYCEQVMASKSDLFWALYATFDELFIGTVRVSGLNWFARTADIGILIGEKSKWGKGMATDAIRTLGTYLFNALGLRKLTAGVMAVNPGMVKVFQKLGFREEGKFRLQDRYENEYYDHIYLGCFKEEFKFVS